jgi:hypothetical protein
MRNQSFDLERRSLRIALTKCREPSKKHDRPYHSRRRFEAPGPPQLRLQDDPAEVNGIYSGFRRNHAKGVCITGYFESNGQGVRLSKAVVFQPGRVPVIGRFALAGSQPYMADGPKAVRSMALSFRPRDAEEWRTGMNDIRSLRSERPRPSTSNCSPQSQIPRQARTFRVSRPMLVVVLNCWVIDTNETPRRSKTSTSLAKSKSARVSRSTL